MGINKHLGQAGVLALLLYYSWGMGPGVALGQVSCFLLTTLSSVGEHSTLLPIESDGLLLKHQ